MWLYGTKGGYLTKSCQTTWNLRLKGGIPPKINLRQYVIYCPKGAPLVVVLSENATDTPPRRIILKTNFIQYGRYRTKGEPLAKFVSSDVEAMSPGGTP